MIKHLIIDVDGTFTDGGIYYDENGNEIKKFCVKDAAGIFACRRVGIKTIVLTGRKCAATERRMNDLHIDYVFQNVRDKKTFIENYMKENGVSKDDLGYIGDDLNDYYAMQLAGFIGCPADSCKEIIQIANYVSQEKGGHGAVREIIEHMLEEHGLWKQAIAEIYDVGV